MLTSAPTSFLTLLQIFAFFGILPFLYILYSAVDFVLFHFTPPSKPLKKYRRPGPQPTYALITGGNGGIGYGIALALVQRGFGVILLGRNAAKLDAAADQLRDALILAPTNEVDTGMEVSVARREQYVITVVLDPQRATPAEIRQCVQEAIVDRGLRISILVNNVGSVPISYPPYRELVTYSDDEIDHTINLNARFMAHLTARMLPVLCAEHESLSPSIKEGKRSLILDLSSGATIGIPYQTVYSSTKGFNSVFSISLSRELQASQRSSHIDVLSIKAGDVRSQGNAIGLLKGSPDSETYGRCIVERVDGAIKRGLKEITPFWLHHINFTLTTIMPRRLVDKNVLDIISTKKDVVNNATKPKSD
ncbi:hypothetical protein NUW58_g4098 [Xylaria curta]|uniref:Uncharacterized protein n=1 Tax=Xylaria curta TaxID=42375 RepID=A0ACC1P813_9PEZI|nr:hypothetical protein NUW58_g4098 [Xylaria curta]